MLGCSPSISLLLALLQFFILVAGYFNEVSQIIFTPRVLIFYQIDIFQSQSESKAYTAGFNSLTIFSFSVASLNSIISSTCPLFPRIILPKCLKPDLHSSKSGTRHRRYGYSWFFSLCIFSRRSIVSFEISGWSVDNTNIVLWS